MEIIVIFLGVLIDRASKLWAVNRPQNGKDIQLIKDFFHITYVENTGAAFSILENKASLLIILTGAAVSIMAFFLIKSRREPRLFRFSLALLLSGAIGNLADRVYYGYVVDFFMIHYKDIYYFPVFNAADIFVVTGAFLLTICIMKDVK